MTEKEIEDYGQGVHELYSAENPATYTPKFSSVSYFIYRASPPRLVKKEDITNLQTESRKIIVANPKTDYSLHTRLPGWRSLMILLHKWIPRSLIV